ncbi:MAG: YCF48-related protein [Sinobacteraceae bacterium]|nr:YCF48-related protein [Nevskiaceae bacterium]
MRNRSKIFYVMPIAVLPMLFVGALSYANDYVSSAESGAQDSVNDALSPISAMMVEHAERGLLLGIANTGKHLVAVGGYGDIIISEDGIRWTQVHSPVDITLTSISFANENCGWVVGHDAAILHTVDGGYVWTVQNYQPQTNTPLFSVLAIDEQHALAVGAFGTLKITDDGGQHWQDVNDNSITVNKLHLNAVTRLRNGDLFVVGERGIAAISNDGRTWNKLPSPYDGSFFGVLPWGERGVVAFGLRGNIYAMTDARSGNWVKISSPATSSLFGGLATTKGDAVLVGSDGNLIALDSLGRTGRIASAQHTQGQALTFASVAGHDGKLILVGTAGVTRFIP